MVSTGKIIKKGIHLRQNLFRKNASPIELQKTELLKLLLQAKDTSFGHFYQFEKILQQFQYLDSKLLYSTYKSKVPIHDYDSMFHIWWQKARAGYKNVAWPGKIKYFALSSGTSGDSSKHIPVTKDMINSIRKTGVRQLLSLAHFDIPDVVFNKAALMLGGSTNMKKGQSYYDADLSGITASKIPYWFKGYYKPGNKISKCDDWGEKLDKITESAIDWDIGFIVGVPAWIQILLEKIIDHYKLKHIHELWPNLSVFVHGGVSMEPYKNSFSDLLGKEITYVETYLASEGFLAFQNRQDTKAMKLVLNNGVFFEFIPFTAKNFDAEGNIHSDAETLLIDEVDEDTDYAIIISTCAGAWRYLIGDVIRFTSKEHSEITIIGRTKHYLSLCGEHLSVDNMNKAIHLTEQTLQIQIKEFTVTGYIRDGEFYHEWYIGSHTTFNEELIKNTLDEKLKQLNDDYRIERNYALKHVELVVLPPSLFYDWLRINGKEGGQHKFPRVLKGKKYQEWKTFLESQLKLF